MLRVKPVKKCFCFPLFPCTSLLKQHHQAAQCRNSANPSPRFFTLRPFFINLGTDPPRSGLFEILDWRKMKSETTFYKTDTLSFNRYHLQQMSSFGEELQFPIFLVDENIHHLKKENVCVNHVNTSGKKDIIHISAKLLINLFCFCQSRVILQVFCSKHRLQSKNTELAN